MLKVICKLLINVQKTVNEFSTDFQQIFNRFSIDVKQIANNFFKNEFIEDLSVVTG